VVRQRLGEAVVDLTFERDLLHNPALSPQHARLVMEATAGPFVKLVAALAEAPERLQRFRAEVEALMAEYFVDNALRQHYLMTRATKR
jgi:hypothetical protein